MKKLLLTLIAAVLFFSARSQTAIIEPFAGGGSLTANNVPATSAYLNSVYGVVADAAGNVYISSSNMIFKVTAAGVITPIAGGGSSSANGVLATSAFIQLIGGLAIDASKNLYFTDKYARVVRKITASGVISTIAGSGQSGNSGDGGQAINAAISSPTAITVDIAGNVYVYDEGYQVVRKISTNGIITRFAGGGSSVSEGIAAISTYLPAVYSLCADASNNIYIGGYANVRRIDNNGIIATKAGNGNPGYSGDGGQATQAYLNSRIYGLTIDAAGSLYISDADNRRIRKVLASGIINTIAGNGSSGYSGDGGPALSASVYYPGGLALNSKGELLIADISYQQVRRVYTPSAPSITSFTPATGAYQAKMAITGSNLKGATQVIIGGINVSFLLSADYKTITANIPYALSMTDEISVTTYGGKATKSGFTFIPAPTITSFTPTTAALGTTVTITGTNFTADSKVFFGDRPASSLTVVSSTTITAKVNDGASGEISVVNIGGTAKRGGFVYSGPAITSFQPRRAAKDDKVTIFGQNFTGVSSVKFGGISAKSFTIVAPNQIEASVNTGATGPIRIANAQGLTLSKDTFEFIPPPTITSFTPNSGATKAEITITGTNFEDVQLVQFGDVAATSFTVISPTTITAEIAYGASGNISVTTLGGTAVKAGFTYVPPLELNMPNIAFCPTATTTYPATVDMPVTVKNFKDLASLQGSIGWDPSLKFNAIVDYGPASLGLTAANFNNVSGNGLTFVWNDAATTGKTLTDNTVLFKIRFSLSGLTASGRSASVYFTQSPLIFEASHKVLNIVPVVTYNGTVSMPAAAVIHASGSTTLCVGEKVTLSVNATGTFQWYKGTLALTNARSASYVAISTGKYKVVVTTPGGCVVTSDTISIKVNAIPPSPVVTGVSTLLLGDTLNLAASPVANASDYIWTTPWGAVYRGRELTLPNAASYMSGAYNVVAVVENCNSNPATRVVTVKNTLEITGRIITPSNKPVPYVNVALTGTEAKTLRTGVNGQFKFPLSTGGNFTIRPEKDNDQNKTNGITALDITFIQAHLLQKQLFDSPYKLIAADANSSGSVTALDLVHIRRVILGIDTTFPGQKMWAFVNSSNTPYYYNPFPFSSTRVYQLLNFSARDQDFIGVKIGDVTYDWNPVISMSPHEPGLITLSSNNLGVSSNVANLELYNDDVDAYNKADIVIPVKVKNFRQLLALQYTLSWNKDKFDFKAINNNNIKIEFSDKQADKGVLTAIWNDPGNIAKTLSDGTILFDLVLHRKPGASIDNESFKVGSEVTLNVAYDNNYAERSVVKGSGIILDKLPVDIKSMGSTLRIFPNPSNGDVKLNIYAKQAGQIIVNMVNVAGKTVYTSKYSVLKGENVIPVDLRQFKSQQSPNYIIQVKGLEKSLVQKVIFNNGY